MSEAITQGIRITVTPEYLEAHSSPERGQWVFTYHVRIENQGDSPAQLLSRHWVITNGRGETEDVKGPGVVGKTPHLKPGESFEYQSFCPLDTAVGSMHGTYHMRRDDGANFDAVVAPFTLAAPYAFN